MKKVLFAAVVALGMNFMASAQTPATTTTTTAPAATPAPTTKGHMKHDEGKMSHAGGDKTTHAGGGQWGSRLKTELGLTDDQVAQMKSVEEGKGVARGSKADNAKMSQADRMAKMQAERADKDAKIKGILTADQYTKWQAMRAEKKSEKMDHMKMKKAGTN